jgi:ABC-2 type transport system ATP-binding protein
VLVLRTGRLVDSVRVADVRQQHRITAELRGPLLPAPSALAGSVDVSLSEPPGRVSILTRGDLAPLLGWLAQQPLERLAIEPVGLRTVYERHHPVTE